MSKAQELAKRLSRNIVTGHDWPNTNDELLKLEAAEDLRRLDAIVNQPQAEPVAWAATSDEGKVEAASEDADPLTPEQEEWVMDLAEKHNLGRRIGQIAAMRGKYPDVFYTDASYRTHELFCFAAELLATQPPAIPAAPAVQASGEREAFEAWWFKEATVAALEDAGSVETECWIAWQARAALASPPASGEKQG